LTAAASNSGINRWLGIRELILIPVRAPWCIEVDQHDLVVLNSLVEVVFGQYDNILFHLDVVFAMTMGTGEVLRVVVLLAQVLQSL
jgi:hypothetical protein